MRTIFITAFNPFILRNILATEALDILKAGCRVVVLVPDYKADFFRAQIGGQNILIEGVKQAPVSRQDIIFRFVDSSLANTETLSIHKRVQLSRRNNYPRFLASWLLMHIFSHSRVFKRLVRWLDLRSIAKDQFSVYLDKYKPEMVFSTDIFHDADIHLIAEAKARGIKTVGMVRSWDNFTTKGMVRIQPDRLIVHNELIRADAEKYGDVAARDIFVSGIPQYDRYISGKRTSRDEFFKKIKLNPGRKLILFSPLGKRFSDTDWQIMEILKQAISKKEIGDAQVLVRFTPNDEVPLGNFVSDGNFHIDRPGRGFQKGVVRDQELTAADMDWLADCLRYSDVLVAGGASIGIDAAIFGKPTTVIHFDGFEKKPHWQSVRRFTAFSHPLKLIQSGALASSQSREQLIRYVSEFLKNPDANKAAREQMLAEQCWKLDGKSGERIGKFLVDQLG